MLLMLHPLRAASVHVAGVEAADLVSVLVLLEEETRGASAAGCFSGGVILNEIVISTERGAS